MVKLLLVVVMVTVQCTQQSNRVSNRIKKGEVEVDNGEGPVYLTMNQVSIKE